MITKLSLFFALSLLWAPSLSAQTTATDTTPTQTRELSGTLQQSPAPEEPVQLGEPIPIEISIVHEPKVDVVLPSSLGSGRWELLDAKRETIEGEKDWTTRLNLKLGVFRPGETTLDPFPIELVSSDGEGVLMSQPISVKAVSSLEDDDMKFSAPRPPVTVWVEDNTLLWVGGFGTAALLLGLFFFAARLRREDEEDIAPPRPAHEVALEKLGRLAANDMVERGEHMVFYVLLSEAIREYLGRRYGFKAVEMTTTEILDALDRANIEWPDSLSRDDVAEFLLHCDSVKFGGVIPSPDTASEKLRRAFTIVDSTRPRGLPVVAEGAEKPAVAEETPAEPQEDPDARWRPPSEAAEDTAEEPAEVPEEPAEKPEEPAEEPEEEVDSHEEERDGE